MTLGQWFARLVTVTVVRSPRLWRLFRGPLARNFDRLAPQWNTTLNSPGRLGAINAALPPSGFCSLGAAYGAAAQTNLASPPMTRLRDATAA